MASERLGFASLEIQACELFIELRPDLETLSEIVHHRFKSDSQYEERQSGQFKIFCILIYRVISFPASSHPFSKLRPEVGDWKSRALIFFGTVEQKWTHQRLKFKTELF